MSESEFVCVGGGGGGRLVIASSSCLFSVVYYFLYLFLLLMFFKLLAWLCVVMVGGLYQWICVCCQFSEVNGGMYLSVYSICIYSGVISLW